MSIKGNLFKHYEIIIMFRNETIYENFQFLQSIFVELQKKKYLNR